MFTMPVAKDLCLQAVCHNKVVMLRVVLLVLITTLSVVSVSLCDQFYDGSPQEQRLISDNIVNAARAEVGLPILAPGQALERFRKFFLINHGSSVCDNNFVYKIVWKAGNNFFNSNLGLGCKTHRVLFAKTHETGFIFSFVRDPMQHFISGYREATFRTFATCCDPPAVNGGVPTNKRRAFAKRCSAGSDDCPLYMCKYNCALFAGKNTIDLARAFIYELLDISLFENFHFLHVALMAGNLFSTPRRPDFIGSLHRLNHDWDRMCATHQCPKTLTNIAKQFNHSVGMHPETSSDLWHHGRGLLRAFKLYPSLRRAVRKMLALDYDCLHNVTS